ncbi:MAG: methyltransferase domain-containing protein [Desulfovibrionaceae bacterium]|nr:methyltransferase domain-containing protein [Desulfovibrionaceae bacterium]
MDDHYTEKFYARQSNPSLRSAQIVLPLLLDLTGERHRVVDLGCGVGSWLSFFHERGAAILGVDGEYVPRDQLMIPEQFFLSADLSTGDYSAIEGMFDLAISLEVAEHLPEAVADAFIEKLCALSDTILFSAAIPLQRGRNHINCQWQGHWHEKFSANGFVGIDSLRRRTWYLDGISNHYKTNMLLYIRKGTPLYQQLAKDADFIPDVVHPSTYMLTAEDAKYQKNKRLHIRLKKVIRALRIFLRLDSPQQVAAAKPLTERKPYHCGVSR